MKTDKLAFVKSWLGYPRDKVDGRSRGNWLQLRLTPEKPWGLVSTDRRSEFSDKEGTAASQSVEQIEKSSVVLREEYVRHVDTTIGRNRLKLLGAMQSRRDMHCCSASGYQSLSPQGVALQVCREEWSAIPRFAGEKQALYVGVADALAKSNKLKLKPQLKMERYRLYLTLCVSFRNPFYEDLVNPRRTRPRRVPSTIRQQFEKKMGKILEHRQGASNAGTKYLIKWKGEPW